MAKKKKKKLRKGRIFALIIIVVLIVALAAAVVALVSGKNGSREEAESTTTPEETTTARELTYEGGVVAVDSDSFSKQVSEMYSKAAEGTAALEYKNDAYSTDGQNFTCYIANSKLNSYDMYIGMYEDSALTKEIYLSGLIPIGSAMEQFKSNYTLPKGDYTCTLVMTLVESDHTTMHAQVAYTIDLHVS
jgi:NADH:ubiquinone oxidoreductase subunit 3 (subunit A)